MSSFPKKEKKSWEKSLLLSGFFISFLVFFSSCAEQPVPPLVIHTPSSGELEQRVIQKIKTLMTTQHFESAFQELPQIKDPSLRKSWEVRLQTAWESSDLGKAQEMLKKGSTEQALSIIDSLRKRDSLFFETHRGLIPQDLSEAYINNLIDTGKEFQAITETKKLFNFPPPLEKKMDARAYAHLAKRRLSQGKDHYALLDLKRGLVLDPENPDLLGIASDLKKRQDSLTEEGFRQYGKQHLRRAIRYWSDALLLAPDDRSLHSNIAQAKQMLERLKNLQHVEDPSEKKTVLPTGSFK